MLLYNSDMLSFNCETYKRFFCRNLLVKFNSMFCILTDKLLIYNVINRPGKLGKEGNWIHVLSTLFVCVSALAFGMFIPKMSNVFILLGCTFNPIMCYHCILYLIYINNRKQ